MSGPFLDPELVGGRPRDESCVADAPELDEHDACGVGFVADSGGRRSHDVLAYALQALHNLKHRGAVSSDGKTGDGAGVLTQIPHRLFRRELEEKGIYLERDRDLAVGMFFVGNDTPYKKIYALVRDEIARSPTPAREKLEAIAPFIADPYRHDRELMKVIIVEVTRAAVRRQSHDLVLVAGPQEPEVFGE